MDASLPSVYDVTICMQGNSGYWFQPPPSLPRRGGTDTLGYLYCLSKDKYMYASVTPAIGFSPHLTSPVGEGQILSVI